MSKIDELFPILNEEQVHKLEVTGNRDKDGPQCRFPGSTYETTRVGLVWQRNETLKQVVKFMSDFKQNADAGGDYMTVLRIHRGRGIGMVTEVIESLLEPDALEPAPEAENVQD